MRELIAAYSIFPNLGVRTDPHVIEQVVNRDGEAIYRYEVRSEPVLDPAVAYVVHSLMRGVVQRGTAASLNASGLGHIAGKTGTTNNYRDAWFVGYSPDLLTAAWVGFDDGTPLRMSSAEAALPVWSRFMSRVSHAREEIRPPEGVSLVEVEVGTGRRWAMGCGPQILEVFIAGTEPRDQCTGMYDPSIYALGYVEPPMLTEEEWAAWAAEMGALRESEIVNDPDDLDLTTEPDSLDFAEPDSIVPAEPLADSVRREEERKRREGQRPPVAPPVSPPVAPPVSPPIVPPPPPPPPTDSVPPVDSAAAGQR
jgi:membrane peptidoglycan carboxypeptidase